MRKRFTRKELFANPDETARHIGSGAALVIDFERDARLLTAIKGLDLQKGAYAHVMRTARAIQLGEAYILPRGVAARIGASLESDDPDLKPMLEPTTTIIVGAFVAGLIAGAAVGWWQSGSSDTIVAQTNNGDIVINGGGAGEGDRAD